MSTIFQQNLRKKTAYDPDSEFQDGSSDAYDASSLESGERNSNTRIAQLPVMRESLIASDLTVEGKIEGKGNLRIAGRLEGDINIQGDLIVNEQAQLNGTLRARQVTLAGKLDGHIESAERVELLDTAILIGDLKTGTLTIAAGSRVRGTIQCGWKENNDQPTSTDDNSHDNDNDASRVDFNTNYSYIAPLPVSVSNHADSVGED